MTAIENQLSLYSHISNEEFIKIVFDKNTPSMSKWKAFEILRYRLNDEEYKEIQVEKNKFIKHLEELDKQNQP